MLTNRAGGRAALLARQLGVKTISLSLTHTGSLAMATVMMEDLQGWGRLFRGKEMEG